MGDVPLKVYIDTIASMEADPETHIQRLGSEEEYHRKLGVYQKKVIDRVGSSAYAAMRSGSAPVEMMQSPEKRWEGPAQQMLDMSGAHESEDPFMMARAAALAPQEVAPPPMENQTGHPEFYRPPKLDMQGVQGPASMQDSIFEEPSLDEVKTFLRPRLGDSAEQVTEDSPEYKRAADFLYMRAYDRAETEGRGIVRVRFRDPLKMPGWVPGVGGASLSPVIKALSAFRTGMGRGYTLGAEGAALAQDPTGAGDDLAALSGVDEGAAAAHPYAETGGEFLGALLPGAGPMRIMNKLNKGASPVLKALAPAGSSALQSSVTGVLGNLITGGSGAVLAGAGADVMDAAAEGELPDVVQMGQNALGRMGVGAAIGGGASAAGNLIGAGLRRVAPKLAGRDFLGLVARARAAGVEPAMGSPREPAALDDLAARGQANVSARTGMPRPRDPMEQAVAEAKVPLAQAGLRAQTSGQAQRDRAIQAYYDGAGAEPQELAELADTTLDVSKRLARTAVPGAEPLPWKDPKVTARELPRLFTAQLVRESEIEPGAARTLTMAEAYNLGVDRAFWSQAASAKDPATMELLSLIKANEELAAQGLKVAPPKVAFVLKPVRVTARELDDIQGSIDRELVNAKAGRSGRDVDDPPELKEIQIAGYRNRERFPAQPGVTPEDPYSIQGPDGSDIELRGFAALKRKHTLEQAEQADTFRAAGLPENIPARKGVSIPEGASPEEAEAIRQAGVPHLKRDQWTTLESSLRNAGKTGRDEAEDAQRALIGDRPELRMLEALNLSQELRSAMGAGATPGLRFTTSGMWSNLPLSHPLLRLFPLLEALGSDAAVPAPKAGPYQAQRFGRAPGRDMALVNRRLTLPVMSWPLTEED